MKYYHEYFSLLNSKEKECAPNELFYEGDFNLLSNGIRVSVIGSRNVSGDGIKRTELITKELVKRGIVVVSGLAEGVDTMAHNTAIQNGGKTIAVLGTPIDKCYPAKNKELLNEIKKNHLAVSQFKSGTRVFPSNFPTRNKTMALISNATIIIEASDKSGTRHQAQEAIRLGRTMLLMENIVLDKSIKWTDELIKKGAIAVSRNNFSQIFNQLSKR